MRLQRAVSRAGVGIGRPELAVGALATIIVSAVSGALVARDGWPQFLQSDGALFYRVALDPFADGSVFRPIEVVFGNAYRYGRPLYPLLGWLTGLGSPTGVRWALLLLIPVAFGASVVLAGALVRRAGREPFHALQLLLLPGVWAASVVLVSEALVAALALATCLLVVSGHGRRARVAAACMLLAKESSAVLLVPAVVAALRRRDVRGALAWCTSALPLLVWWAWVRLRVGEWPFRDPSLSRRQALGAPLVSYVRALHRGTDSAHLVAFAIVALTIVVAVHVWRSRPGDAVAQTALAFSCVLLLLGDNAVRFSGELIRLTAPAEVLVLVALMRRNGRTEPWRV